MSAHQPPPDRDWPDPRISVPTHRALLQLMVIWTQQDKILNRRDAQLLTI